MRIYNLAWKNVQVIAKRISNEWQIRIGNEISRIIGIIDSLIILNMHQSLNSIDFVMTDVNSAHFPNE